MNFYMLCATQGEPLFVADEWAASDAMCLGALQQFARIGGALPA